MFQQYWRLVHARRLAKENQKAKSRENIHPMTLYDEHEPNIDRLDNNPGVKPIYNRYVIYIYIYIYI